MTTIKILDREAPLKIEWLRSFLAVNDLASFTKAAKTLHLSQPAVSTHVRELEENLSTRLFEHVGNTIRLTRSGETVAREARRILDDVRELQLAVADSEGAVQGTVRIGASTTPGNYLLPERLAEFERRYPRARAALSIGNSGKVLDLLAVNEVDLGVVGIEPDPGEFVSRPFARDEIVVFAGAGRSLARKRKVSMGDLAKERFLLREQESATRQIFEGWRSTHRMSPEVMVLGCPETVKRATAAGLGVGILSRHSIEWEVKEGKLAELDVPSFPIRRWLFVVHHRRKHLSRALRALLEILENGSKAK